MIQYFFSYNIRVVDSENLTFSSIVGREQWYYEWTWKCTVQVYLYKSDNWLKELRGW